MNSNFRLLFFIVIAFASCKPTVKKLGNNPSVDYYLVGRIRTAKIAASENPYVVKVLALDPSLIDKPIRVQLLDSIHFSLTYIFNGQEERKSYLFEKEINEKAFRLVLDKRIPFSSSTIENLRYVDFEFCVKGEE